MNRLTVEACRELKPGQVLKDHVVRGLQLRATATGKTWLVYHRANGVQRRPSIGYFPALTIELARDAARALLASVAKGNDPSRDRQESRHAPTVADLCGIYVASRAKRNKPRTMEEIERHCRYIRDAIGSVRVAQLTVADVDKVLDYVANRRGVAPASRIGRVAGEPVALVAANRVRETLRGMLNHAEMPSVRWRPLGSNPVKETVRNKERKRRVILQPEMLPAVARAMQVAEATNPAPVAALWCILLAGTRVTELLTADRSEWSGDRITLAEHKTDRTGEDRIIYLPRQVSDRLARLPIYPNGRLFGSLDRFSLHRVWDNVRHAACCPHVDVRDFRRTFVSTALSRGATLDQIGELMSHGDTETTKGYAWLIDTNAATLAQSTADAIEAATLDPKWKQLAHAVTKDIDEQLPLTNSKPERT